MPSHGLHKPHIPPLRENKTRTGFFELEQFISVRDHLPNAGHERLKAPMASSAARRQLELPAKVVDAAQQ
jgi:hypothetical protein